MNTDTILPTVKPLVWSEAAEPSKECPYNHVTADSPFGAFRITWKGWKEHDSRAVDESPWGFAGVRADLDGAKHLAEAEYAKRVLDSLEPIPAQPATISIPDVRAERFRKALAGLVGSDDPAELEAMLAVMKQAAVPEVDKAPMIESIKALLNIDDYPAPHVYTPPELRPAP